MRQLTSHETLSGAIQRCICKGVVLATTAFALIGCSRPAEVPAAAVGSVAVIDLDAVAQSLGSDKQIAQSLSSRQSSLNDQLVKLANSYTEKLEQQKQAASQSANGPQVELASWQQQASANLTKARQQVESDLAQHRAKLVAQFRQQIKPFAREAARNRGLSVIVTRNDSVIYDFSEAVDITSDVVEAIRNRSESQQETPQVARHEQVDGPVTR